MKMKTELQQIINTCIELQSLGKKPSVGMLKAKLLTPLPIPTIIKGLRYWKDNKQSLKAEAIPDVTLPVVVTEHALGERVAQLESDIVLLKSEIKGLKQRFEDAAS
jgi:hypothetical protein